MFLHEFNSSFAKNARIGFDNAFNKMLTGENASLFTKLAAVGDTTELVEKFNSSGSIDQPNYVDESEDLATAKLQKGYVSLFEGMGIGHTVKISKEMRLGKGDVTTNLIDYVNRENEKALQVFDQSINNYVHSFYNNAFVAGPSVNSKTSYYCPDDELLISANHKLSPDAPTFSNLLDAQDLNPDAVRKAEQLAGAFRDGKGNIMPLNLDTIIVKKGSLASYQAKQMFYTNYNQFKPTTLGNVNIYMGGAYNIIETPFLKDIKNGGGTDKTNSAYFMLDSRFMGNAGPYANPIFINFRQRPTIEGEVYEDPKNLDWTYKFYGHWKGGIRNIPFGIFGSLGA